MEKQGQQTTHTSGGGGGDEISLRPLQLPDIGDFMLWATDPDVARLLLVEALHEAQRRPGLHGWHCPNSPLPPGHLPQWQAGWAVSVTLNEAGMEACQGELSYAL
ncbi:hypothetical protein NL676_020970 [Syzygium grande]|nr:hypothetical protein NL676_020970 [Syzygium grande]